jgi:hypothetical protein
MTHRGSVYVKRAMYNLFERDEAQGLFCVQCGKGGGGGGEVAKSEV